MSSMAPNMLSTRDTPTRSLLSLGLLTANTLLQEVGIRPSRSGRQSDERARWIKFAYNVLNRLRGQAARVGEASENQTRSDGVISSGEINQWQMCPVV